MNLQIFTDGACRGNPGHSSYAFVIKDGNGALLHEEYGYIGVTTNNVAEYTAGKKALEYVVKYFQHKKPLAVKFFCDSKLLAEQLAGRYKVKNPNILVIFNEIRAVMSDIDEITFQHIPREENFIADKLANIALDSAGY